MHVDYIRGGGERGGENKTKTNKKGGEGQSYKPTKVCQLLTTSKTNIYRI